MAKVTVETLRELTFPGFVLKPGAQLVFNRQGTAEGFVRKGQAKYVDSTKRKARKSSAKSATADSGGAETSDDRRSEEIAPLIKE